MEEEKEPVNIQGDSSLQVGPGGSEKMDKENKDLITERREEESDLIYCSSRTGSPEHLVKHIGSEEHSSFFNNPKVLTPPKRFISSFVGSNQVNEIYNFLEFYKEGGEGSINKKGPAPPNPFRSDKSYCPFVDPSTGVSGKKIYDGVVLCKAVDEIFSHLASGGTDVERIKQKFGIPDEKLRAYKCPTSLEEYRENQWILGGRFIQACVEKLNQTTNQFDDWELLDVLFIKRPHDELRYHMHFRAMRKSKADPCQESLGLYCAVVYSRVDECHVLGCVLLENDCPGGSKAGTLGKCLDAHYSNARSDSWLAKDEDDMTVELSRSINSARKIQMQGVYKVIERERDGKMKTKEILFTGLRKCNDGAWFPAKRIYV